MTRRLRERSLGVTMLEVMVVIGIMAILFTMGTMYYRGMQNRNAFQNEVERFGGELRNMGTLARAAGDLQPAFSPRNEIALGSRTKGAFQWQVWMDGALQQSSLIGSRGQVDVQFSKAYVYRQALTRGACLVLCQVNQNGQALNPIMQVVFKPDGSPVDRGEIRFTFDNRTLAVTLSSVGSIDGPR